MGSSILYGAINDLDISEASIPAFTPPGMPDTGANNKLYGTDMNPVSPWAIGKAQASSSLPLDVQTLQDVGSLNGQTLTQLSAESYMRGSDKYNEQADQMINEQEAETNGSQAI